MQCLKCEITLARRLALKVGCPYNRDNRFSTMTRVQKHSKFQHHKTCVYRFDYSQVIMQYKIQTNTCSIVEIQFNFKFMAKNSPVLRKPHIIAFYLLTSIFQDTYDKKYIYQLKSTDLYVLSTCNKEVFHISYPNKPMYISSSLFW